MHIIANKMSSRTAYVIMAILVAGVFSLSPAFAAQAPPVTITTDQSIYDHESTIMVSGEVAFVRPSTDITIRIKSPLNNLVSIDQVKVNPDGTFSASFSTNGPLWKYDGVYEIVATYGSQEVHDKLLVQLTGGILQEAPTTPGVVCGNGEVDASGNCIPFSITGGDVTGASINEKDNSIVVSINAMEDGTITLSPSSDVIRGVFMALVDGQEWDDVEIDGNSITVMFPAGTEEIEIIGTFVVPEFGTIAIMILAVAIVSIIAVSARSKLSILPKY